MQNISLQHICFLSIAGFCATYLGCAAILYQPQAEDFCTTDQAISVGVKHAMRGISPIENIEHVCDPSVQDDIRMVYLKAYRSTTEKLLEKEREIVCNYDYGFKQGMNDSQRLQAMREHAFTICHGSARLDVERGYREGYQAGGTLRPTTTPNNSALGNIVTGQNGSPPSPLQCTGAIGSSCVVTVKIKDSCNRIQPLEYRFFNPDSKQTFPSTRRVFVSPNSQDILNHDVQCRVGERICFGARSGRSVWGLGLEGTAGCQNCCVDCNNTAPAAWKIEC